MTVVVGTNGAKGQGELLVLGVIGWEDQAFDDVVARRMLDVIDCVQAFGLGDDFCACEMVGEKDGIEVGIEVGG